MRAEKVIIVDDFEYRVLIEALADRRNDFIAGEKPADDVSDLLIDIRIGSTPRQKRKKRENANMKNDHKKLWLVFSVCGWSLPVWLALLIAPTLGGGLPEILPKLRDAFTHPFHFTLV